MLSNDIKALQDRLRVYKDSGLEASPEAVTAICSQLGLMVNDARRLEHGIPANLENVVPLAAARHAVAAAPDDGGSAA